MNMGDCFLKYRQIFKRNDSVFDTNSNNSGCGKSLKGVLEIRKDSQNFTYIKFRSRQILELLGTQESYKDFRIIYASKDSLHLSFIHKQYGQEHRISDYLVPINVQISDRDFHHM